MKTPYSKKSPDVFGTKPTWAILPESYHCKPIIISGHSLSHSCTHTCPWYTCGYIWEMPWLLLIGGMQWQLCGRIAQVGLHYVSNKSELMPTHTENKKLLWKLAVEPLVTININNQNNILYISVWSTLVNTFRSTKWVFRNNTGKIYFYTLIASAPICSYNVA